MLSYHGDLKVKERHVALCEMHRDSDKLIAGRYEGTKACSVGCLTRSYRIKNRQDHAALAAKVGLPEWLVHVQDKLFEGLPEADRGEWHVALSKAIPVGVDLDRVKWQWLRWNLMDLEHGVLRHTEENSAPWLAVKGIVALIDRQLAGDPPSPADWDQAARAAWAAAWAEAAWAARAAAWAARAEAAEAARAAAEAAWAAARAARAAHFRAAADELLRLLQAAGVVAP